MPSDALLSAIAAGAQAVMEEKTRFSLVLMVDCQGTQEK